MNNFRKISLVPIANKKKFAIEVKTNEGHIIQSGKVDMQDLFAVMDKEQYACARAGQLEFFMDHTKLKKIIND